MSRNKTFYITPTSDHSEVRVSLSGLSAKFAIDPRQAQMPTHAADFGRRLDDVGSLLALNPAQIPTDNNRIAKRIDDLLAAGETSVLAYSVHTGSLNKHDAHLVSPEAGGANVCCLDEHDSIKLRCPELDTSILVFDVPDTDLQQIRGRMISEDWRQSV